MDPPERLTTGEPLQALQPEGWSITSGQNGSRQERYEAAKAQDEKRNATWVQNRFGGPVGQTLVKELPLLGLAFLIGLSALGWRAGLVNVALLLIVILGFRTWARRRHGISSPRPTPGSSDRE